MGEQAKLDNYTSYETLVEFVDIYPSLVEPAGLPSLEKCPDNSRNVSVCREGRSLLGQTPRLESTQLVDKIINNQIKNNE